MTLLQAIILGIVQGITEFLPISSSAHLVILPFILGWDLPSRDAFIFDILVQMGTLIAVIAYFWQDLIMIASSTWKSLLQRKLNKSHEALLGWYILISTFPAVIFGLILGSTVEKAFDSPTATASFLLLTAGLLVIGEKAGKRSRKLTGMNLFDAVIIGLFQALALFPGVSRSGSTITGGMVRNLERYAAARFSFLMSVPVMIAAGVMAAYNLFQISDFSSRLPTLMLGLLTSALVGYLAIRWLLYYLTRHSLYLFAGYCVFLSVIVWIIALVG